MDAGTFHKGLLHPKHWLTWVLVFLVGLFTCLPVRWRRAVLAPIGRKSVFSSKGRLRAIKANINICFPDLSSTEKQAMLLRHADHAGFALGEIAWTWYRSLARIKRRTYIEGLEHLQAAQASQRPIVLLLPHMLYLDYAVMCATHETPCAGIFNTFKNPVLDWLVGRKRGAAAMHSATLHKDPNVDKRLTLIRRQSGRTVQQIISRANQGFAIIHLMDEDLGAKSSVFAPLFGIEKATLANMSTILKKTNALLVPMTIRYDEGRDQYALNVSAALDLNHLAGDRVAVSTEINKAYEKMILQCPDQYMWNLRIFRSRPEGDEREFYKGDINWD